MVQTLGSVIILAGHKKIIFEKPLVLRRIFLSVRALAAPEAWCESRISFDDPGFLSYYTLAGYGKYFQIQGEGLFQGAVWVYNVSTVDVKYTYSEILV